MKVIIQQFLSNNHSWSVVGQNIARSLITLGHSVDLFSTNGISNFPTDLTNNLIGYGEGNKVISGRLPDNNYDCQISYTAMKNFPRYLSHGNKNRFGIYCYEFGGKGALPYGFAKNYQYCDQILAPSHFASRVFIDSGIPENRITVVPHGINCKEIDEAVPYALKTKKSVKILINLGQIHRRKNFYGALEMFGNAFDKNSDVCLILKIQDKAPKQQFELSFRDIYKKFNDNFPNHAEVEIIREFIPNIYSLYKSCNITFSPSHCEGFGMVPLEGLACGVFPIASNYGGFLDFLNNSNSLLIDGKIFNVPPDFLYYQKRTGTTAFMPSVEHGVTQLRNAVSNIDHFSEIAHQQSVVIRDNYSWDNVAKKIISLYK